MDFLKAQLDRIQQQLAGLNATQKMLTVALVAIMAITVAWWGKYAGEAEMVPLLNQSLSAADLGRMQDTLQNRGIVAEISGDKLLVHSDKRLAAMSALTFARAIPHITEDGFKDLISLTNPFDSPSKDEKIWNRYKQTFLSQVIAGIKNVARADVVIDPTSRRGIGSGDVEPSASVNIILDEGVKESQKLVDSAAALLAGSQSGLGYNHITVVVNGTVQRVHDPAGDELAGGSDQLQLREQHEAYEEEKVKQGFPYIRLAVKVTVSLNTTSVQTDEKKIDGKNAIQKTTKSVEETDETPAPAQPTGGEAGAVPNVGLTPVAAAPQPGAAGQTHQRSEENFVNYVPETHTTSRTPAGGATTTGAAVQVPYGFFVAEYKRHNPAAKDPTDKELQPVITTKLVEIQKAVATMLAVGSDKVSMGTYPDIAQEASIQPVAASSMGSVSVLVGGHAKEIALGMLALMSLFMASMMVRKGTPAVVPATPASTPASPAALLSTEPIAGEAAGGNGLLDGMELNEDTIKSQQMVEQVSTMVRENPDAAAALVKRWLNRT